MSVDAGTLAAICIMALATVFNRTAGFFLMRLIPVTPRVRKILDCLPGSVLVALLAPGAVHGDKGMIAGLVAALVTAKLVRNDIMPVAAAMAAAAAVRAFLP
ncbi:AzlD family protein [Xanthobacter sediminis]|uniref:AzlD family protein n=1 Tax=Xanthobacter sediminis TaxID=3119926 RepID=UPI003727E5D6